MLSLCYRAGRRWIHSPKSCQTLFHNKVPKRKEKKKKPAISLMTETKMYVKGKIDQRQTNQRIKNWLFDNGFKKEEKFLKFVV